jgi:stage V sporulation protein R
MPQQASLELRKLQDRVEKAARTVGLDFFTTVYEVLDFDEINMVASYTGFPTRYPHWKWGMEYERLSKSFEYGMSRIYELVINNNPCYAYLLDSNSMVDQKLVMCHVTGHNDFFKNNFCFQHTNRKMIDEMANHAARIRRYMDWYGVDKVESFIDSVLSVDNLIDYHSPYIVRAPQKEVELDERKGDGEDNLGRLKIDREYMDRFVNPDEFMDAQRQQNQKKAEEKKKFPREPTRDVMAFLLMHAPLFPWQKDIVEMLRDEAYYFAPQAMTKIMNEGWASYWHSKLMTESVMGPEDLIDFADRHASVMATSPTQLNPYKLGMELYRDIEERWNKGQFGSDFDQCNEMAEKRTWDTKSGLGRKKIFDVRKIYNDVTFIDEFFTLDFCKRQGFFSYAYDRKKQEFLIDSREFVKIKKKLLGSLTNLSHPSISIIDGNFENRTELLLEHHFEGVELDPGYAKETLKNLYKLWTRPIHLLTTSEDRPMMLSFDGENYKEKMLSRQV